MSAPAWDIIARIETPFDQKFGVPRQSGIADCPGRIVFEKPFRDADAVRGLEGFSHIWLIWQFDRALRQGWSPTVRPPRLGGNERVGVFATRSPFRPNGLGLSAVELERVALDEPDSPVLYVRGADMVSGTPIEEYRVTGRGGLGVKNYMVTDKTGDVVGMKVVDGTEDLLLVTAAGILIRTPVENIRVAGRATQGVIVMRFKEEGDKVISMALADRDEAEETETGTEGTEA